MSIFGAEKIITQYHALPNLYSFYVGFDLSDDGSLEYRIDKLVEVLINAIPEFAYGHHAGNNIPIQKVASLVRDSAKSIYKIDAFREVREIYSAPHAPDMNIEDKYLKRGEFGELILHLMLRDFYSTVPLVSKIYFKDAYGATVHGFDAVHIEPEAKRLWLGESKLYTDGKAGVIKLIEDIKEHFTRDYLHDEFTIITKKISLFGEIPERRYWIDLLDTKTKLSDVLDNTCIPLLCTYSCNVFEKHEDDSTDEFKKAFEENIAELESVFRSHNNHPLQDKLKIILILFPLKCKNDLIRRMHKELTILSGGF